MTNDYEGVTSLQWAEYEFATIEHDHKISEPAAKAIRAIFKRLADNIKVECDEGGHPAGSNGDKCFACFVYNEERK